MTENNIKNLEEENARLKVKIGQWSKAYGDVVAINQEWQETYKKLNEKYGSLKYQLMFFVEESERLAKTFGLEPAELKEGKGESIDTKILDKAKISYQTNLLLIAKYIDEKSGKNDKAREAFENLNRMYERLRETASESEREREEEVKDILRRTNATLDEYEKKFDVLRESAKEAIAKIKREKTKVISDLEERLKKEIEEGKRKDRSIRSYKGANTRLSRERAKYKSKFEQAREIFETDVVEVEAEVVEEE